MTRRFRAYIPLMKFSVSMESFEIAENLRIEKNTNLEALEKCRNMVSSDEWEDVIQAPYMLIYDWHEGANQSISEAMNMVLLSLWLIKPNRVEAHLYFKIGVDGASGETCRNRLLDRMQWISVEEHTDFIESDLEKMKTYYQSLSSIYDRRERLSNAMILTLNGCWNHFWQGALILYTAAIEALLTYSKGSGLTNRLAIAYACLTESEKEERDCAYLEFYELYSIRSDAIHGRMHNVDASNRLPALSEISSILRNTWQTLLSNGQILVILDKSDSERKSFFNDLCSEYEPPSR